MVLKNTLKGVLDAGNQKIRQAIGLAPLPISDTEYLRSLDDGYGNSGTEALLSS